FIGVPRSMDGFSNPDNDPRGLWRNTNCKSTVKDSSEAFEITDPETSLTFKDTWAHSKVEMQRMASEGVLIFPRDKFGQVRKKEYFNEFKNINIPIKSSLGLYDAQANTQAFEKLMGDKVFQNPKNVKLMKDLISYATSGNDIILDFFAGSGTTAHAVLEVNAEYGGTRRFIVVQINEECDPESNANKSGFLTIADICKERIRRAGKMVKQLKTDNSWNKDVGFRVLKVDSSNMTAVHYRPDAIEQGQLYLFTDNIKSDRTPEDLLFQVLLDWGVDFSLPIQKENIQGKTVFFVSESPYDLIACFDSGVNEDLVKKLARYMPLRAVFRDMGFISDAVKINVEQIFRQLSPSTEVKSI
ncbi:MAG: site-specific DNA-methyltransferase, partial [Syntrophales bacterium LBB04]|nr:site-specific DNA-methyltransferase [Syntrophales bacterium LBB04]